MAIELMDVKLFDIKRKTQSYYEQLSSKRIEDFDKNYLHQMVLDCEVFLYDLHLYEMVFSDEHLKKRFQALEGYIYSLLLHLKNYVKS